MSFKENIRPNSDKQGESRPNATQDAQTTESTEVTSASVKSKGEIGPSMDTNAGLYDSPIQDITEIHDKPLGDTGSEMPGSQTGDQDQRKYGSPMVCGASAPRVSLAVGGASTVRAGWGIVNWPLAVILVLLTAGVSALPLLMKSRSMLNVSFLNSLFAVPLAVTVYLLVRNRVSKSVRLGVLGGFSLIVVYTNFLIGMGGIYAGTSKFILLLLMARYIPVILFFIVGFAYTGGQWRSEEARKDYLKYWGEFYVYTWFWGMILGLFLSVLLGYLVGGYLVTTMGDGSAWPDWASICAIIWIPVATFLVTLAIYVLNARFKTGRKLPEVLANFGFVLLTLILLYMICSLTAWILGIGPVITGVSLLVFFIMLYAVLSERSATEKIRMSDYANLLVCLAVAILMLFLIIIMLVGIVNAQDSVYWLTLLGDFLVVFVNLAGIIYLYYRVIRHGWDFGRVQKWVTGYLEVYFVWVVVVSVVGPLVFLFR